MLRLITNAANNKIPVDVLIYYLYPVIGWTSYQNGNWYSDYVTFPIINNDKGSKNISEVLVEEYIDLLIQQAVETLKAIKLLK